MEVAWLALFISIFNLSLILWDRFPRANVAIETEDIVDDTEHGPAKSGECLWITISNRSAKRIFIANIYAEWSKNSFYPFPNNRIELEDIQRWESTDKPDPTTRFWIEPWGNAVLSADVDNFESGLQKQITSSTQKISYRVIVQDGLNKKHKSNRIRVKESQLIKLFESLK